MFQKVPNFWELAVCKGCLPPQGADYNRHFLFQAQTGDLGSAHQRCPHWGWAWDTPRSKEQNFQVKHGAFFPAAYTQHWVFSPFNVSVSLIATPFSFPCFQYIFNISLCCWPIIAFFLVTESHSVTQAGCSGSHL